jgi:predicted ribosome quality control (RQC) complex YloA/Tae2 family protein
MLSLRELRRAVRILEHRLAAATLQRLVQTDDFKLALSFRFPGGSCVVLLCCRPEFARLSFLDAMPQPLPTVPSFAQYLRARLAHATLEGIGIPSDDRRVEIRLRTRNGTFVLILSVFGARSNIYLVDPQGKLAHAMRPLDTTRRELVFGEPWKEPGSALRSEGEDRWELVPDGQYIEEIERDYQRFEVGKEIENLTRKIENALSKEETFLDRKAANLQEDLAEARRAAKYQRQGELIKSVLHKIRRGDDRVTVTDYETDESLTIPLDPALSPSENLEAFFRQYQKEQRGVSAIEQQLSEVDDAQAALETLRVDLRNHTAAGQANLQALRDLAQHPRLRRLMGRYYPQRTSGGAFQKPRGGKDIPGRLLPKRYQTGDRLEIWVGRNDEGNDYLTTRLARGNDLFFHLEGHPGSHVVLRTGGRKDPPPESVLAACELAVHFSRLKSSSRADVRVAYVKDIRKPKGSKPGLVYVIRGKTVHLRREGRRLKDILASRLDQS